MSFLNEAPYSHGTRSRTAVLLVNLGTPEAPQAGAVRRYLKEFLSDPRVVEIPRVVWWPILNGIILTLRPRKSAAKYAAIWTERGSPLMVHSREQATLLRGYLGEQGIEADVVLAMRYGEPSIASVLAELQRQRTDRVLVVPMYPQYSGTTTASVLDALFDEWKRTRNVPEVRWVKHFHDDPGYIDALKQSVLAHWKAHGRAQDAGGKLVMSFHGVPKRTLMLGDPYHCECQKTGRLLAEALGLGKDDYLVTFQSRFGKAEWLQPYTAPTLHDLARRGVRRVDVMCPGFPADCLETLEEIAMEGKQEFVSAGGQEYRYIPCLNGSPAFIHALARLAQRHMQGWDVARGHADERAAEAARSRALALLGGASRLGRVAQGQRVVLHLDRVADAELPGRRPQRADGAVGHLDFDKGHRDRVRGAPHRHHRAAPLAVRRARRAVHGARLGSREVVDRDDDADGEQPDQGDRGLPFHHPRGCPRVHVRCLRHWAFHLLARFVRGARARR